MPGLDTLHTAAHRESLLLAPYAMHSCDSRGREHREPEHPYRGPFQRDRDRILHSAAYRRLSGKMQVFTGEMGDYHRTRLTHTHEVASIARTIGRALRLNEDLIEALALFHDIGHPPFGHAGEDALDDCMAEHGGFSHNRYAITIARELEQRYTDFPGLNLCHEVLDSQATRVDKRSTVEPPLLEAQVVDLADSITYDAHDTDDAVKLGLVSMQALEELPLIRQTVDMVCERWGPLQGNRLRRAVVHQLIDLQVSDVLAEADRILERTEPTSAVAAQKAGLRLQSGETLTADKEQLESFLYDHVYRHPKLLDVRLLAQRRLRTLHGALVRDPGRLPERYRQRIEEVGLPRAAADYLAGMTDRYCDEQFQRLVGP